MKKAVILLLLLIIVAFSIQIYLNTGIFAAESKAAQSPVPKMVVPEPKFDFGKILEGELVTHAFIMENKGHAPLRILNVQTSCGCTTAQKPETIAPGAKDQIVVQGNTSGRGGSEFNKTITVTTDDPKQPEITLQLRGQVTAFARIEPNRIILRGRAGEPLQAEAVIAPTAEYPFKIVKIALDGGLTDKIAITITERGGSFYLLARNLMTTPGHYAGNILLTTDSSLRPQLNLFVTGRISEKKL